MSISAERLGVAAGDGWLFQGLDLAVEFGECLVLTGANGTGKSTLLRCLYGMQTPTEGAVTVCARTPDERSTDYRRRVSVLLDDAALFDELSPRQHLDLLLRSYPGAQAPDDVAELLGQAGLDDRVDVPAGKLSAGQRRRLLLLGCVARPHEVLLLDEPERALDADGRLWLAEMIRAHVAGGASAVVASHYPPLVEEIADHLVELG